MDLRDDHFALFSLAPAFALDIEALERRYRDIQTTVHPDRFASLGENERRQAMQWATRVNEAYRTLKHPLSRARYLLGLRGHEVEVEHNTAMPPEFLVEQMELREAVAEARGSGADTRLEELRGGIVQQMNRQYGELGVALDEDGDNQAAGEMLLRLMFQEKLLRDIDEALEAIEA